MRNCTIREGAARLAQRRGRGRAHFFANTNGTWTLVDPCEAGKSHCLAWRAMHGASAGYSLAPDAWADPTLPLGSIRICSETLVDCGPSSLASGSQQPRLTLRRSRLTTATI